MPLWDKMMLHKRYIIECINELLKNKAKLVHSRHVSVQFEQKDKYNDVKA